MKNISNELMEIITAIQHYIDKTGNTEIIEKYYHTHGTYSGIVGYLNCLEDKKEALKKETIK